MLPPALVFQQSAHWNQRWSYCSYYETFSKNYGPKFDLSNSDTFHMDWSTLCVYELGTIKSLIGWCIQPFWCSQWCKRHWAHACTTDQTVHCCHQNMSKYRHDQSMTMTCQNGCSTLCKQPQSLQRRPGWTVWEFQGRRKEDVIYSMVALSFAGFWFGLGSSPLLPYDVIRSHRFFFAWSFVKDIIRIIKGISKGKRKSKDTPRAKGKTEVTRAKVSPARAPLVLQLPALNACTAASMATSSVTT